MIVGCKIAWCEERTHTRGWCKAHYSQQTHGAIRKRILTSIETPKEYFERIKIVVDPPDGERYKNLSPCWLWPYNNSNRYPEFQYNRRRDKVHRWS